MRLQNPQDKNKPEIYEKEFLNKEGEYEIFFTKDPKYLDQYFALRHKSYREDNGWVDYDGSRNRFDDTGHITVVTKNDEVIGGIRVSFSDECKFLSNETPGTQYEYRRLVEKYDKRENLIFTEAAALVVHKDFRKADISTWLFKMVFELSEKHGSNYVFAIAIATICRNDRMTAKKLGYDGEIVINYPWERKEVYNYQKMFPVYSKLK